MPWRPLPRIAFAVATYPFEASSPADLPLELGDELYIIEEGGVSGQWFRGYLIAPPSLLGGLTCVRGQTLEARVFSGIFPRSCVEVREVLGEVVKSEDSENEEVQDLGLTNGHTAPNSDGSASNSKEPTTDRGGEEHGKGRKSEEKKDGKIRTSLALTVKRDPNQPKPPAPVPMLKIGDETPTSASEPLVDEIASCLREWHSTHLHELLLSRNYSVLDRMTSLVHSLDMSRRQLLHNVLTSHELVELREKTVWDLVRGNKLFTGEVIVRDPATRGRVLTGEDPAVEITKLQSVMSLLEEPPRIQVESMALHHLLLEIKGLTGSHTGTSTAVIYLASKIPGSPVFALSESYIAEIPPSGAHTDLPKSAQIRTMFTDLGVADIGDMPADNELFLVVKIKQPQPVITSRKSLSRGTGFTANSEQPLSTKENGKTSRRSLVWAKSSQRTVLSKNSSATKMSTTNHQPQRQSAGRDGSVTTVTSEKVDLPTQLVSMIVGIGVMKLNSLMKTDEEVEHVLNIWAPSTKFDVAKKDLGEGWNDIIRDLMGSKTGSYERCLKAERIQLRLRPFVSPDAEALIKATPTILSDVNRSGKMGFSGAPTKPRSDIYVTIGNAFLPRHVLLLRPAGSATPLSPDFRGLNILMTLEVRKSNGERIENCIYPSSNGSAVSSWESSAVERGDIWDHTIRLVIPPSEVHSCHIVMALADFPNSPFAICYMPLWDQQAFIRDGHHSLLLYKYDETTSYPLPNITKKGGYLTLPWNSRGKDDSSKDETVSGAMATLRLQSYLCSTRFSQDKVILGLLNWKAQPREDIPDLLKRLIFVPEIEIVKLLDDVFDALFGILVEFSGDDDIEDLVFRSLVMVLGIVHDRRFNLGPLVDDYAENKFNYPFATQSLVKSFTRLLANPTDPEISRRMRATFKVVRHILKFINHARGQQKAKEVGIGIKTTSPGFSRHLRSIFKALDGLMQNTAPMLVGSQTLAVQHFHTWLPELNGLLTSEETIHIAIDFMDACANVKGKLVLYKLLLIINYSRLELFLQPDQRAALAASTVRWIAPHWGKAAEVTDQWRDQVRLCCSVLSTQVEIMGPEVPDHIPKIIDSYLAIQAAPRQKKSHFSLLFPTSYPFPNKPINGNSEFDEALVELAGILAAISSLPQGMQLELAEDEMATLLDDVLRVHLSILRCDAFPSSWLSIHIYHHKTTMKTLQYVASILLESFLPHPDDDGLTYNTELWKAFFTTLLTLVGSDALGLEAFPEQKRRAVWKIAGDVRELGADLLRQTWDAIGWDTTPEEKMRYGLSKMGGYQVQYVPGLVGPILELCLSVHEGLRHVAVEVLQTMIASEWNLSEDLSAIQVEMIDSLDQLFKTKPLTESILQKLFISELLDLFQTLSLIPDDPLYAALTDLVSTMDEFLDLLVAVHSADDDEEASHMMHRLRLMDFLRDMQKEQIFIRYVHQLAALQADSRNYTAAGLALRLHADLYEWNPTKFLPALADPELPAQSSFERKERIYFDMIKNFEEGEAWSSALASYKELQQQYEENVFDFSKLARTQRAIATVYESIGKADKIIPKYFRVTYRGLGFPPSLRDKDFVFEGGPIEKTSSFTDRLQQQHPSAQIVVAGDIDDVEGQFLQVSSVSPHRDLDHNVFQRSRVPHAVRDFLLSSHCQQFSTTVRRNTTGPVSEHWAEKIVYVTADQFPTILARSEVVSVERVRLSPMQTALERIIRKTQEITALERRFLDGEEDVASLLLEALKISVSPKSDAGIARYRELLPTQKDDEAEAEQEPELNLLETSLKMAIIDHVIMIKRCLTMISKSSDAQLHSAFPELSQTFEATFSPEMASLHAPQPRLSTPTPAWSISSPTRDRSSIQPSQINGTAPSTADATPSPPPQARTTRQDHSRFSILRTKNRPPVSLLNGTPANGILSDSESGRSRSRSKENGTRRSFFGAGGGRSENSDGADGDWVTDSGAGADSDGILRSESKQDGSVNIVGSVRKRLSMLKLGKKSSKGSVLVDSVAEE